MKTGIGMAAVLLGIASADSPNLLVPVALVALGTYLLKDVIFGEAQ